MWKVENKVIATVIGSWELTVSKGLEKNLRKAGTTVSVEKLQTAALYSRNTQKGTRFRIGQHQLVLTQALI